MGRRADGETAGRARHGELDASSATADTSKVEAGLGPVGPWACRRGGAGGSLTTYPLSQSWVGAKQGCALITGPHPTLRRTGTARSALDGHLCSRE